jgi:sugar phosphate isomerase/epimerase
MKLSLSVRVAESATRKDRAAIPIEQLAPRARDLGYQALCMRASVVSVSSPPERVAEVKGLLDRLGLGVSMVTGDLALAANTPDATDELRNVTPYLDLAERLDSERIRVMMHGDDDIPFAQRAADEARERGISLCHQMHFGTMFETVDQALAVVARVDRPNFGVTYEPGNLLVCGDDWGPAAIARLAPHILNVYFQNMRVDPNGDVVHATRRRGPVPAFYVPIPDRSGVDLGLVIGGLKRVGYDGWFTVHQPLLAGQTVPDAMAEAYEAIDPLL